MHQFNKSLKIKTINWTTRSCQIGYLQKWYNQLSFQKSLNENISDIKPKVNEVALKGEHLTLGSNDVLVKNKSFCDQVFEVFEKTNEGSSIQRLNLFFMKQNSIYRTKYFKTYFCGSFLVNCKISLQVQSIAKLFTCEQKASSAKKRRPCRLKCWLKSCKKKHRFYKQKNFSWNEKWCRWTRRHRWTPFCL